MGTWLFFGVLIAIGVGLVVIYNRLVSLKNRFKNAFAQIDVQLQRRHDLIPNLVETAKAYMDLAYEALEAALAEAAPTADSAAVVDAMRKRATSKTYVAKLAAAYAVAHGKKPPKQKRVPKEKKEKKQSPGRAPKVKEEVLQKALGLMQRFSFDVMDACIGDQQGKLDNDDLKQLCIYKGLYQPLASRMKTLKVLSKDGVFLAEQSG